MTLSDIYLTNSLMLGMVGIGGLFVMGGGYFPGTVPQVLGALSVLLASVNVAGGFVITKRMLDMFKRWCPSVILPVSVVTCRRRN